MSSLKESSVGDRLLVIHNHVMHRTNEPVSIGANCPLTTHVLDTSRGRPASGLSVQLFQNGNGTWKMISQGLTDENGRCPNLVKKHEFVPAVYKLHFDTFSYYREHSTVGFYPYVEIVFEISNPDEHYHVPLILSQFSYSTYRGS